jgi:hypothetical protein
VARTLLWQKGFVTRRSSVFAEDAAVDSGWPFGVIGDIGNDSPSFACHGTRRIDPQDQNQGNAGLSRLGQTDEHYRYSQSDGRGFAEWEP